MSALEKTNLPLADSPYNILHDVGKPNFSYNLFTKKNSCNMLIWKRLYCALAGRDLSFTLPYNFRIESALCTNVRKRYLSLMEKLNTLIKKGNILTSKRIISFNFGISELIATSIETFCVSYQHGQVCRAFLDISFKPRRAQSKCELQCLSFIFWWPSVQCHQFISTFYCQAQRNGVFFWRSQLALPLGCLWSVRWKSLMPQLVMK